ncbi:MAG: MIP/aquaporin family protein [Planctomycetaceae bacterium]|jgi:glycerol uptake facilitator protein
MSPYLAEFIGTMILVLLGNGVCANVNLSKSLGKDAGWIVVTTGWGLAVTIAVYLVNSISGAHLNPAVTIALATIGRLGDVNPGGYIAAQIGGAFMGAVLVWLTYLQHWGETEDQGAIRGSFCTGAPIPHTVSNLITEAIGTFVLVLGVLVVLGPQNLVPGSELQEGLAPALVGVIVWSIGLSLGGSTGYAINPARDLGPRIAHAVLPIPGRGSSEWHYAWIPIVGPVAGGVIAALFFQAIWPAS